MRCWITIGTVVVAFALALAAAGCKQQKKEPAAKPPDAAPTANSPSPKTPVPAPEQTSTPQITPVAPDPPPAPTMPQVLLTEALADTCRVKVGDALPRGTLAEQNGRVVEVYSTLGPRLTVFYFWKGDSLSALQGLEQIDKNVAGPHARRGVAVVAVNEGDPPRDVAEKLKSVGTRLPSLLDPGRTYFTELATTGLPRVYLVDSQGKILWFDTEYSRGTERTLLQAIDYVLAQP
ncbi:MAG: redoxin domain-containing protein [Pirellulales bacterium]|nr:redoxin domain-containing protein [Pirellulales bacterium]